MLHQKKKVFGILFFALLVSATFLVKNIVGATVDSIGNSITGTNINIANVASYNVTMEFSGTLDSGDMVVVELIDASLNTISDTYISTGDNETTITINFVSAATLSEGAVILSGSIFDSGLNLITGEITTTILLDTILPTFDGVISGTYYSGNVEITFSDTNLSGAALNGTDYTSGDTISAEGSYEFIVTDTVGNSTGATFIIDKSEPTFDGVISGTYYSGDVTITFSDMATINGTPINSGDTIITDGIYTLIVIDEANNQTGAIFTIDKTPPVISNITSGNYFSGNITPTIVETNFSGATLNGTEYIPTTEITGEATYELIITDLANNITAITFTIDTTLPTAYVEYTPTSGSRTSGNVVAVLTGFSETLTGINTGAYIFSSDGIFLFTFEDLAGNTGEITATVNRIDIIAPVITNITSGQQFSGDITPTIVETNYSGATLNGSNYISGTTITGEGIYELIVYDLASNSTGITFTIDTTPPTFSGVTSGTYYTGTVTLIFSDIGTLNGVSITSGYTTGDDGTYILEISDIAGNVTGATFIIDNTEPTFAGIISGSYYSGNQAITFNDTNLSGATLNGSPYTNGTAITGEGIWEIIIYDLAGNSTGAIFTIDKTEPTFAGIISGSYYSGNQAITFNDTNLSGATLNGSPYISGTTISSEGTYVFIVNDLAGNSTGATFVIDATNPTTTASPNGSTGRVDVSITLTPIDTGATIELTYYCIDTANTCTPNITGTSATVTGASASITTKYLRFYSIDKSYNAETIHSARFYIDKELPSLTGTTTFSSSNTTNTGYAKVGDTITVLFQSHEALTGTPTMTISGGSLTTGTVTNIGGNNYSGSYVMKSGDTEGTIGFNIFMTDLVGNTGTIFTGSTIIFDKTAPAGISITAPTTTTYLKGDPDVYTILWNMGTDSNWSPTSILLEYSLTNFVSTTNITTGTINDGSHTFMFPNTLNTFARIRIIATDLAGNIGYFTGNQFSIDNTPPTDITITYPGLYLKGNSGYQIDRSGGIDANPQTIVLSYTTNGTTFNTICTRTNNEQNCSRTTPNLNSATVQLRTIATDEVGMNKQRTTPTFIIDSTAPTAIIFTDNNSNRRNTDAIATGTSTDALAGLRGTGMVYRIDTAFTGTCNGGTTTPPTFTGEGYRTGYACISDNAGNIRTGQQSYQIDKTLPTLQTGNDITVNTATIINITGSDALAGISGYIRSQISGPGTITFSTGTTIEDPTVSADTDGDYVLQILLIDNANNSTTETINFTRDTVNPILNGATSVLNTTSQTPNYSFTGDEAGTISYSGSCSSATTAAISGLNTITFTALANATYSTCQLRVTDTAGNSSSRLDIPTFTVSYSAPSGGGGGGGGGSVGICTSTQLMCVSGIYAMKAGVNCQGGDLGKPCGTDVCVDGDYSGNPNDGICYDPTKVEVGTGNTTGTTITSTGSRIPFTSPYNEELTDAYSYAYGVKITTVPNIKRANLTGVLIRSHLAKMMSQYATKVLGKKPDTTRNCIFKDMNGQTEEFKTFAIMACQLGLMGLKTDGSPADIFNPDDEVNRAIFGTTLSRALFGDAYNGGQNRYAKHLDALKEKAVMNYIDKPFNRELRGYVMLMMMRADQKLMKSSYSTFTSLRGSKIFVPGKTITVTPGSSQFTETELDFIKNLNKEYQFNAGYTVGESDLGVKYLQYVLKSKGYYTGAINGINTNDTVTALYEFQFDNNIVDKATDQGAGYLGPSTRELLNPLLETLLNP